MASEQMRDSRGFMKSLDTILAIITSICVLVMMLLIVANVVTRTFFNSPIPNTNETSTYWLLVPIVFLGYIVAQNRGEHIEARLVYDRLGTAARRDLQVVGRLAAGLMALAFAWFTFQDALHSAEISLRAGTSSVVIWPVTFVLPLGFLVLGLQFLWQMVQSIRTGNPDAGIAEQAAKAIAVEGSAKS